LKTSICRFGPVEINEKQSAGRGRFPTSLLRS